MAGNHEEQIEDDMDEMMKDGKIDKYGNNTNFPDEIMSDMTMKGILGKEVEYIYYKATELLWAYYMKTGNSSYYGDINLVKMLFIEYREKFHIATCILEEFVNVNISGLEDIFIAVYGVQSDEVYVIRRFIELVARLQQRDHPWDEDYMWNDCRDDRRMKKILESL